ncbi:hypothetical protein [Pelobacter seleniigenes]|uniref:hypothetical protein n=1 Tax=Pelobacter seleniigenes TaxID=407188 RepID=UPI0004A6DB4C|nr:hypothetical protein [Pelobacter seleniigenes]
MKNCIFLAIICLALAGCVNKHPYPYTISADLLKTDPSTANWILEDIQNDSSIPMTVQKQTDLTEKIAHYLQESGFNIINHQQFSETCHRSCFVIKPRIIETKAEISQNEAGWHGTSEDPLNFWSHFSPGRAGMQFIEGTAQALSLYVEIYVDNQKCYENAGGIELVGKYNKYSFRTTSKKELVEDPKKFQKAMEIAFKPLIEVLE